MRLRYDPRLKELSRQLRKAGVLSEVLLWEQLKCRKICGFQFTRQKPIDSYIVDFYCSKLKLVIEVDGVSHEQKRSGDSIRQQELQRLGLAVLRFTDSDVRKNLAGVIAAIRDWVETHSKGVHP